MVDEEHLEALDFMLWMASSHRAASITHTHQSTVIRRVNAVLSIFNIQIDRSPQGWRTRGTSELLKMERCIHQLFRFRGRRPLRLHAPHWSAAVQRSLPIGSWIINPAKNTNYCENPDELLRERIIDACLLTPTQVQQINADQATDLVFLPIYRSAIEGVVWTSRAPSAEPRACTSRHPARSGSPRIELHLFPFLPLCCRSKSLEWFQQLPEQDLEHLASVAAESRDTVQTAFLTPEMQRPLCLPFFVAPSSRRPYTEMLVFLAEHGGQPGLQQLHELLVDHFAAPQLRTRREAATL